MSVYCAALECKYQLRLPRTNADRIRGMSDEELAEFIAYSTSCETCVVRKGGSDECHNTNCSTAWLDYLRHEVTNTEEVINNSKT